MNEQTYERTNIRMDERKDENYIPLSKNAWGTIKPKIHLQSLLDHNFCIQCRNFHMSDRTVQGNFILHKEDDLCHNLMSPF